MSTPRRAPLLERQAVYWTTGAASGILSQLSIFYTSRLFPSAVAPAPINPGALRSVFIGAGMRFMTFDLSRHFLRKYDKTINPSLRGALAGCAGGIAETLKVHLYTSLFITRKPFLSDFPKILRPALLSHGSTLFLCLGVYSFFCTELSYTTSPPPIPLCFFLAGVAGAVGVPAVHVLKNRSLAGAGVASATGFVRVGTIIGCQVISSAEIVKWLESRG